MAWGFGKMPFIVMCAILSLLKEQKVRDNELHFSFNAVRTERMILKKMCRIGVGSTSLNR